ncbi:DUF1275 family protein [Sphingobium sp. H39-3-25]|uniref:YoaK family protein n=1 Tax=Sphingobium arseniciresistens TaxID=3030834 RepID=UPI0023B922A5|nr:DUF1275 family protein [Sphingobium arseniciresistens]
MIRYDRRTRALAYGLSALSGFVDANAFMMIGGFFVAFMSGNTTRLAVGLALHGRDAAIAGTLIALFVLGVMTGALIGDSVRRRRRAAVLALLTLLITSAAAVASLGHLWIAALILASAMGAENAIFQRDGEVSIGLTYMTGTLVKCGQRIAGALRGGDPLAWLPYLTLWMALAAGAIAGALAWREWHVGGLWIAAAGAALLGVASIATERE